MTNIILKNILITILVYLGVLRGPKKTKIPRRAGMKNVEKKNFIKYPQLLNNKLLLELTTSKYFTIVIGDTAGTKCIYCPQPKIRKSLRKLIFNSFL